jgi:hypothetical protein
MLLEKIVDKFDDKLMSILITRNMLFRWGLLNVSIVYSQVLDKMLGVYQNTTSVPKWNAFLNKLQKLRKLIVILNILTINIIFASSSFIRDN